MANCKYHPGRVEEIVPNLSLKPKESYCIKCYEGMFDAATRVDRHVNPKICFVTYVGSGWKAFTELSASNTGCAHWVAHQKKIYFGQTCLEGFTIRVKDLIIGKTEITNLKEVQVGDIYVTPKQNHCGMVEQVFSDGGKQKIKIKHCSSRQGGVVIDSFETRFQGKGKFFR